MKRVQIEATVWAWAIAYALYVSVPRAVGPWHNKRERPGHAIDVAS